MEELWDRQYRRLTLTFDPGRVETRTCFEPGPRSASRGREAVRSGRRPRLARYKRVPMSEGFRKSFRGGPAERIPPDPKQWRLVPPKVGALDDVVADFSQPMDYPLLLSMLQVTDGRADIAGTGTVAKQETEWRFTPRPPLKPGPYHVIVDTRLEDFAGNHIGHAFDIDMFQPVTPRIASNKISLPFVIPRAFCRCRWLQHSSVIAGAGQIHPCALISAG